MIVTNDQYSILISGIATILTISSVLISGALAAYSILTAPKGQGDELGPQTLDSFSVTQAKEGSAVTTVYGRVRVPGAFIFYGNLKSKKIKPDIDGFKGVGSQNSFAGFQYFLDFWQTIGYVHDQGTISLIETYIDNKLEDAALRADNVIFNNGVNGLFPASQVGPDANAINGVCHIFYEKFFLGDNVTTVPTIHFVVERTLPTTINNANMSNGNNPAAIIYDILKFDDVPDGEIDIAALNVAADFYFSKGQGLNLIFEKHEKPADRISRVLSQVDGTFFVNANGQYSLKAFEPTEAVEETMVDDDFKEFSFRVPAETQLANDFKATFTDESQEFSTRVIPRPNQALILKVGERIPRAIDLTGFRDRDTATSRTIEVMEESTFTAKEFDILTSHLGFSLLNPGSLVQINKTDTEPKVSVKARVLEIDTQNVENNGNRIKLRQITEDIPPNFHVIDAGSSNVPLDLSLVAMTNIRIFELPYNKFTGFEPSFLMLAKREKGFEDGFECQFSQQSTQDYISKGLFTSFSQHGTLDEEYPNSTFSIDTNQGILYTPTEFDPVFNPISDDELFLRARFAIIGNEMIAFEDIQPEGVSSFRLSRCIRGVLGTPVETHSVGSEIWLVDIGNNVLQDVNVADFFVKLRPVFRGNSIDLSAVTPIAVTNANKAKKPRRPGRLTAERFGSNVTVTIFPNIPDIDGYGQGSPQDVIPPIQPYPFLGDFIMNDGTTEDIWITTQRVFVKSGAFTMTIKHRRFNLESDPISVDIGAADGLYIGD